MDTSGVTAFLVEKYREQWSSLSVPGPVGPFGEQPTNPLLLDVPPVYFEADCKVMVFGKETNGWEGPFPCDGVNHLLETYRNFYTSGCCYAYGGQFWNGVSQLRNALRDKLNFSGKTMSLLWNNLIKIGKAGGPGAPCRAILDWEDRWFDVVRFELNELKPDIVIFFSGPDYDRYIGRICKDAAFEPVNERPERQLARVKAESCRLPTDSIRTYHPNYLWRNGFYEYLAEIMSAIHACDNGL